MGKQARERELELAQKVWKLMHRERELRNRTDQTLARLRHQCHLLTRMNELRQEQCELLKKKFNLQVRLGIEDAVQLRLEQINEERQPVVDNHPNPAKDKVNFAQAYYISSQDFVDKMQRMDTELRCGICSELLVFATSLNCMHTFCQYCVTQWKSFEENRAREITCPVCREPIVSEKRNFSMDNIVGIMIDFCSEEEKNSRKELVNEHQELTRNLSSGIRQPGTSNPFYQITNRNVFMGAMQVEETQTPPPANSRNVTRRPSRSTTSHRPVVVRRLQGSVRPRWR